jgi:mono/diheme cytochrome c family protein
MSGSAQRRLVATAIALMLPWAGLGCYNTYPDYSEAARGPTPLRGPSPKRVAEADTFEKSLTGGEIFSMYCSECHNPRPLSERPFSNFKNVAVHMRVRANLTGREYAKLAEFFHQWHDVPPPTPPVTPSPKRTIFVQPINELRDQTAPPTPLGNPGLPPQAKNIPAEADAQEPTLIPTGATSPMTTPSDNKATNGAGNNMSQAASLYRQRCLCCHDGSGAGVSLRKTMPTLPNFTDKNWQAERTDEQLFNGIWNGKGPFMPASHGQMTESEARDLVAYIRSMSS